MEWGTVHWSLESSFGKRKFVPCDCEFYRYILMKRTCLLIALLIFSASTLSIKAAAQTEEAPNPNFIINLYTGDITYTPRTADPKTSSKVLDAIASVVAGEYTEDHDGYADAVRAEILKGFSKTYRLRVLDKQFDQNVDNPKFALLLDGVIASVTTTTKVSVEERKDKNGKKTKYSTTTYQAAVHFTLNLKNIETKEIVNSHSFTVASSEYSTWFSTKQSALDKAMAAVSKVVYNYYDELYPLTAHILELGLAKHDKQKELYIDLGSKHGVYEGLTFGVYKIKMVAGREGRTFLGRIKIKKVEGADISFCKVVSGGKDIKKCLDDDEPLLIISRH